MNFFLIILFFLLMVAIWENVATEVNYYSVCLPAEKVKNDIRIVHISDLHIAPWALPENYTGYIQKINELDADYVFITGDFITHYKELIPSSSEALSQIKASKGIFCVPGNHDYWVDADYLIVALEEKGFKFLLNESYHSAIDKLTIVGVDDKYTHHNNLEKADEKNGVGDETIKILLSHTPDIIEDIKENQFDIILCGHTHGGQVRAPVFGAFYIPSKYKTRFDQGWFYKKNSHIYVNRGLGSISPPIRLFSKKEICVIEISAGNGKPGRIKHEFIYY